jgi:nephrocystin-3
MIEKPSSAAQPRVVRVFVSSTFRDMQGERDELVKRIFPQLRKLCEQRGVAWTEVDLRWGITDEQSAEGQVLPICLAEIQNCRPYFIGLLGERYGWVPDAIPAELIEREPWLAEHKDHSVTELEILHGVLNNPEMAEHAFFYFRDPAYIEHLPAGEQAEYREAPTKEEISKYGAEDADRRAEIRRNKLAALKERIRASGFSLTENYKDPEALGERVLQDLTGLINRLYPEGAQPSPLDREAAEHEAFAASRAQVYIGRKAYFDRLDAHAAGEGDPLVVLGESGSGKSALLANWALRYREEHPDDPLLMHFIGGSPYSSDWAAMLRRIMGEFKRRFDIREEIPDEPDALRSAFANWLHMAAAKGRVVLILDALNQLEDRDGAPDMVWLPPVIPAPVRLILSTLPGRSLEELKKRGWPTLQVTPLEKEERRKLIVDYLAQFKKTLDIQRVNRIVAASQTENPLFLRALLDELRVFGVHELLDQRIDHYLKARTVVELYGKILARYEEDYERKRPGLMRESMSLLWSARRGLSESELLELLGSDGNPLPRANWSSLYLAAEQALVNRSGLINFAHDFLRQAVHDRYLSTEKERRNTHIRLADYFFPRTISPRKIDELPWQLAQAQEWKGLNNLLADLEFFETIWAMVPFEVKAYWVQLEANSPFRLVNAYRLVLKKPEGNIHHIAQVATLLNDTGHPDEALRIREKLVDYYRQTGDLENLISSLGNEAVIHWAQGDLDGAMAMNKEVERLCRNLGNMDGLAASFSNQAAILQAKGELNEAMAFHKKVEDYYRKSGNKDGLRVCLGNQAVLLFTRGHLDEAMALHKEEERICRELGNLDGLQHTLGNQVAILEVRGVLDGSLTLLKEQERICRELGNKNGLQYSLGNQAVVYRSLGRLDEAMALFKEQERICRALGSQDSLQCCLGNQAIVLKVRGDLDGAMKLLKEQERICVELSNKEWLSVSLGNQALVLQDRGCLDEAMRLHKEEERLCRELDKKDGLQISLNNQALILQARGDLAGAMSMYEEVERLCREVGNSGGLAASLGNRALIFKARGELDGAMALHKEEERLCRELGMKRKLATSLSNQALILQMLGDLPKAKALSKEAEHILREIGDKNALSLSLANQVLLFKACGELEEAVVLSKEAERLYLELSNRDGLQEILGDRAGILFARGDVDGAIALYNQKERICREIGSFEGLAASLYNQAILLARKKGKPREALPMAEEAYRVAVRAGLSPLANMIAPFLASLRG